MPVLPRLSSPSLFPISGLRVTRSPLRVQLRERGVPSEATPLLQSPVRREGTADKRGIRLVFQRLALPSKCCLLRSLPTRGVGEHRNVVERCFSRLEQNRALATRYDKRAAHLQAMTSSPASDSGSHDFPTRPRKSPTSPVGSPASRPSGSVLDSPYTASAHLPPPGTPGTAAESLDAARSTSAELSSGQADVMLDPAHSTCRASPSHDVTS